VQYLVEVRTIARDAVYVWIGDTGTVNLAISAHMGLVLEGVSIVLLVRKMCQAIHVTMKTTMYFHIRTKRTVKKMKKMNTSVSVTLQIAQLKILLTLKKASAMGSVTVAILAVKICIAI
jgi:hypothetical protein